MPVLEVEIADDGSIGTLPDALQTFMNKRIAEAKRKATDTTEDKLKPYLADPVEMERLRQRDKSLADIELKEAERSKEYEKARQLQEDAHEKAKAEAVSAERKKTAAAVERVRAGVAKGIRAAALAHGARAESLDELERLLAAEVDLDENLDEFVVDPKDRKARRMQGDQPVTVEGLVAEYLKTHTHHVAAQPAQGGNARGGATRATGTPPKDLGLDERGQLRAAVADDPSPKNIGKLLKTTLTRAS